MENYFWNTEESYGKKNFILVIYDIVDNKRRVKFAKKMEGYGFRVQKSAFEGLLPDTIFHKLLAEIPLSIDKKEDSVRVYRMTGYGEVKMYGQNVSLSAEDVIVI